MVKKARLIVCLTFWVAITDDEAFGFWSLRSEKLLKKTHEGLGSKGFGYTSTGYEFDIEMM